MLNEIGCAAIRGKMFIPDRNGLDRRSPTGIKTLSEGVEINWPMLYPNRLEHLDRNYLVEYASYITVILQPNFHLVREAGVLHALTSVSRLFG